MECPIRRNEISTGYDGRHGNAAKTNQTDEATDQYAITLLRFVPLNGLLPRDDTTFASDSHLSD